jgi:flagellar biosynthesis protein FlhG
MSDQANELRELMRHIDAAHDVRRGRRRGMIFVTGGKGGVGTTTLAVNLAAAFAQAQHRTLLVEATPSGGQLAMLCGQDDSADRKILPAQLKILTPTEKNQEDADNTPMRDHPFWDRLDCFDCTSEIIVVDGGSRVCRSWRRLAAAAESAVVVATADPASSLGAYETIKELAAAKVNTIYIAVNQIAPSDSAEAIHERLARTSRRMLGVLLESAGRVPFDARFNSAARRRKPLVYCEPKSLASQSIRALAGILANKMRDCPDFRKSEMGTVPLQNKMSQILDNKENNSTYSIPRPIMREHYGQTNRR